MAQFKDEELLVKIARRLKSLREEKGLSQEEVYNELDIHIGRIELARTNLTISTLSRICAFYGISLANFFKSLV